MNPRNLALFAGGIACAALAGLTGQSLVADAQAPAPSDKTLYASTEVEMESNLAPGFGSADTLLKITIKAPSAGTAEIRLDAQLWTDFPATAAEELENVLTVRRCTAANTVADSACTGGTTYWFHKAQQLDADDNTYPYSMSALVKFKKAGKKSVFLNAQTEEYDAGLWADSFAHVQAAFTPKRPIAADSTITLTAVAP